VAETIAALKARYGVSTLIALACAWKAESGA
jgi:hypothetical protein